MASANCQRKVIKLTAGFEQTHSFIILQFFNDYTETSISAVNIHNVTKNGVTAFKIVQYTKCKRWITTISDFY